MTLNKFVYLLSYSFNRKEERKRMLVTDNLGLKNCLPDETLQQTGLSLPSRSPALADNWYSLSYLYFSPIGTIISITVGLFVSLITG